MTSRSFSLRHRLLAAGLATLCFTASTQSSSATIIAQELFDAIAGPPPGTDGPLDGKGDTVTSIGFTGVWNAYGNLSIYTASNFDSGIGVLGPPVNAGQFGGVWNRAGGFSTAIFATRPLAKAIDFSKDQVLYYSFIANNSGDTAMGIGFTTDDNGSQEFVGAGLTWNNATTIGSTTIDASNAAYIGYGAQFDSTSGPYGIRSHEPMNSINGPALIVVRLTISSTAPDKIDMKRYSAGDVVDTDPSTVVWSDSDSVDSSMLATNMLLWLNGISGSDVGELDAIRVGTTWADVTAASSATDPYQAWATGSPNFLTGTNALPSADPDHDGVPNALEFLLGGDPLTGGSRSLLPTEAIVAGNVEFTFRRASAANVAPLPTVEYSTALTAWTTAQDGTNGVSIVTTANFYSTGVDRVVVKIPQALAAGSKLFVRLNANR